MTAINPLSTFHQWLLAEPNGAASACAIILHGDSPMFSERFIAEIADYLNEYDDDGAGHWLSATTRLVSQITDSPELRRLLGIDETRAKNQPAGSCRVNNTLDALGHRGRVIFQAPSTVGDPVQLTRAFHVGIGTGIPDASQCHLILNPELMDSDLVARVIGDVFLEWLNRGHQRVATRPQDPAEYARNSAKDDQTRP